MADDVNLLSLKAPMLLRATARMALVDESIQVLAARDLVGVKEQAQAPKSVQLYGPTYKVAEFDGVDTFQVDFTYIWVVAVRNPADQKGGTAAEDDAGPICWAIVKAFGAWRPPAPFGRMKLSAPAPPPMSTAAGFNYYPFAFTTRVGIKCDRN